MIDKDVYDFVNKSINKHENFIPDYYQDSENITTIGIGFTKDTLKDHGISIYPPMNKLLAQHVLNYFIDDIYLKLRDKESWVLSLPDEIIAVVIEMIYQMGFKGFLGFKDTIKYLKAKDYFNASREMLDSKWGRKYYTRAKEMSDIVKSFDDKDQLF